MPILLLSIIFNPKFIVVNATFIAIPLAFGFKEIFRKNEYYFYYNNAISKKQLMFFCSVLNLIIALLLLMIVWQVF